MNQHIHTRVHHSSRIQVEDSLLGEWAHNWEVILACILLLILMITFLLFIWRIIFCCNESRKRRKVKQNYLNLEDHMPSVTIVIPSKDPHYRVLEECHSKQNLASAAIDNCSKFELPGTDLESPSFHTKPFHMQQMKT